MKGINLMKTKKTASLLFALVLFSSCPSPFQAGLGSVVDIRPPTITLELPGAGDPVWGVVKFTGEAKDDYVVDRVEIKVTNIIVPDDPDPSPSEITRRAYLTQLGEWNVIKTAEENDILVPINRPRLQRDLAKAKQNDTVWSFDIDTTQLPDGDLKIQLCVYDSESKKAETGEIVFLIRNELPAIMVSNPDILRGIPGEIGKLGGTHLNYYREFSDPSVSIAEDNTVIHPFPWLDSYPRKVDVGSYISGTISYSDDIYTGQHIPAVLGIEDGEEVVLEPERYPPQIRIWHVSETSNPSQGEFALNEWPSPEQVPWQRFKYRTGNDDQLFALSVGSYQFLWPVDKSGYWAFEIRAQSAYSRAEGEGFMEFRYPRDSWPTANASYWDDPVQALPNYGSLYTFTENRYVLMYVNEQTVPPQVELHGLEDFLGENGWNGNGYNLVSGLKDNEYHPYVNLATVDKNGPFTLRVKASHQDEIISAETYWEMEGTNPPVRGRFIWDPAIKKAGDDERLKEVPTTDAYNRWGFQSLQDTKVRSFIFTYNHDGADRIPNSGNGVLYHDMVAGRSKVQVYTGSNEMWELGKRNGLWPTGVGEGESWNDIPLLAEGVYNLETYARSNFGALSAPLKNTIRIDTTPPEVEITTVEGVFDLNMMSVPHPEAIVNGVVQPRLRFSDSRPEDSGLRGAAEPYYANPGADGILGSDQRYVLVGDYIEMDKIINIIGKEENRAGWWPPTPASADDELVINDLKVYKHGAVFNSTFKFKTSKLYGDDVEEPDVLPLDERTEYYLYVFVRDKAFNVGYTGPFKITVDPETDKPRFIFSVGVVNEQVTDPHQSADNTVDGFNYNGTTRNKLVANDTIRLRITDDDSLDLGAAEDTERNLPPVASQVKVKFAASKDTGGVIEIIEWHELLDTDPETDIRLIAPQDLDRNGVRRAVTGRQLDISQAALLKILRHQDNIAKYSALFEGDPNSYNSLPDGLYQMEISISDYAPLKLKMDGGDDPIVKTETRNFWLAVDNTRPVISEVLPVTGTTVDKDKVVITGTVSDKNGPIIVRSVSVTDDRRNPVPGATVSPADVTLTRNNDDTQWAGTFSVDVTLNGESGNYMVTLELQDRFGNFNTIEPRYAVDVTPPSVSMRSLMVTFDRDFPDVNVTDTWSGSVKENRERLVNGVVTFSLSAFDNSKVEGLRWWLLPANKTATADGMVNATGPAWGQVAGDDLVAYNAYPSQAWSTVPGANNPAPGLPPGFNYDNEDFKSFRYGELRGNLNVTQYIDTSGLDDGEYYLHVLGIDTVGNVNKPIDRILQTIYILHEEDKPYFQEITPDSTMTVGRNDAFIRGTVYEDDGFVNPTAPNSLSTFLTNTVRVWVTANDPGTFDINSESDLSSKFGAPKDMTTGVTRTGKNLNLAINLPTEFASEFVNDGMKYYVVEATDSWYDKMIDETGAKADNTSGEAHRKSRRTSGSFMYDTVNPSINLTHPISGLAYGGTAGSDGLTNANLFGLEGTIRDTNLRTKDGQYYIMYSLDGGAEKELLLGTIDPADPTNQAKWTGFISGYTAAPTAGNGPEISFKILPSVFTALIGFMDNETVSPGNHTLVALVQDKSGKDGNITVNFIKDTDPPQGALVSIEETLMQNLNAVGNDWWTMPGGLTNQAWNDAKRAWLKTNIPPVIYYNRPNIPQLTGSFEDEVSDLNLTSFKYEIDNLGERDPSTTGIPVVWDGSGRNARWTVELVKSAGVPLDDGVHTIKFSITDNSGNVLEANTTYVFRLDSAAPTVTLTALEDVYRPNQARAIAGTARDANLRDVHLQIIRRPISTPTAAGTTLFNGWLDAGLATTPPTANINSAAWTYGTANPPEWQQIAWQYTIPANQLTDGNSYEVTVYSTDHNNVDSEQTKFTFIVDGLPPVIAFGTRMTATGTDAATLTPSTLWTGTVLRPEANKITGENLRITGSISDTTSAIKRVQSHVERWEYAPETGNARWVDHEGTANAWIDMTADLNLGARSLDVNWTKDLTGAPEGLYRMRIRAADSAGNGDLPNGTSNNGTSNYMYFFYELNPPTVVVTGTQSFYSLANTNQIAFNNISVDDLNRFKSVQASIRKNETGSASIRESNIWAPGNLNQGPRSQSPTLTIPNLTRANAPDGSYIVTFTAVDMANETGVSTVVITLDSTAPASRITYPQGEDGATNVAARPNRTHILIGGEGHYITGTTNDSAAAGVESSGVRAGEMWYHLGYLATGTNVTYANSNPTEVQIRRSVLGNTNTVDDGSAANNALFDAAANGTTTSWFKLTVGDGTPTSVAVPNGFRITNNNIYDWRLEIPLASDNSGGLKMYTEPIQVKGQQFNPATAAAGSRFMTRPVPEATAGRAGIVSLPLWIRVVDQAGNVTYQNREIWIYPDGDIPTTSITNPPNELGLTNEARGGTVSVTGIATDNTAVYSVVYRVFVDNVSTNNGALAAAYNTPVQIANATRLSALEGTNEWNILKAKGIANMPAALANDNWYFASLQAPRGEAVMPWNFSLNSEGELTSLIASRGFTTSGTQMVRVLVDVFVFDGTVRPGTISTNGAAAAAVPNAFRRVFFLKSTAPNIDTVSINDQAYAYAGAVPPQRGNLTIRARLDAGSGTSSLTEVDIQRPTDGNSWTTAWVPNTGTVGGLGVTVAAQTGQTRYYDFTYTINSATLWPNSGGDYRLSIRIRDNENGEFTYAVEVGVDNFAPVADTVKFVTSRRVAGQNADFLGRAFDYTRTANGVESPDGRNRGIRTVYAWIRTQGTNTPYVNMNTGAPSTNPATQAVTGVYSGRTLTAAPTTAAPMYGADGETVSELTLSAQGATTTINRPTAAGFVKELSSGAAVPGSGMTWTANYDASDVRWSFTADTTQWPAGWITLHYIVVDNSGNASYYTQEMIVMNNRPLLETITLYTDNRGYGAVYTTHDEHSDVSTAYPLERADMSAGYLNTGFISKRRNIGFEVKALDGTGNGSLNYRLQYVSRERVYLTSFAQMNSAINLYTIASTGDFNANDWAALGVNVDNPGPGTHFVYNAGHTRAPSIATGDSRPSVWKYTQVSTTVPARTATIAKGAGSSNPSAKPNPPNGNPAGNTFNYADTTFFGAGLIKEDMNDTPTATSNFFLIRVWDNVDNKTVATENDQLHDAVVIYTKVYLTDSTAPTAQLYDPNPYFETAVVTGNINSTIANAANPSGIDRNILKGGLYNTGRAVAPVKSGYIDPRANSAALNPVINGTATPANGFETGDAVAGGPTTDKLSGRVILRGRATDNQQVATIRITVNGQNRDILQLDTNANSATYRQLIPANNSSAWVVDDMHWERGHTVEWAYVLDTQGNTGGTEWNWTSLNGGPYTNNTISVRATDEQVTNGGGGNNSTTVTQANNNANYNSLAVDIVPYVTGLERRTPAYATTRSRQGWYSFYQGETGAAVTGFNLGNGAAAVTYNAGSGNTAMSNVARASTQRITFDIPDAATSSRINVSIGSTDAWNHSSTHATRSWNREYNVRYPGSELWTNKPYAHIWRTTETTDAPRTTFAGSGGVATPAMSLQYTGNGSGTLHGVWANMGADSAFYARVARNASYTMDERRLMVRSGDPHSDTDISFWNGTTDPAPATATVDNFASIVLTRQDDGQAALRVKPSVALGGNHIGGGDYTTYIIGPRSLSSTIRWQNVRISKSDVTTADNTAINRNGDSGNDTQILQSDRVVGDAGRVFVTAYDASYKKLFFTVRTTMDPSYTGQADRHNADPRYLDGPTGGPTTDIAGTVVNSNVAGTIARSDNAGEFSAIDYDSNGRPVVAYYDQQNDTLRLAYANSNNPTAGNNWTRRYVLPEGHALRRGSGTYVSMKIQRTTEGGTATEGNADIIHLAFFNSAQNTLVYAYGTRTGTFTAYTVDTVVRGGMYTDISLDETNNPWIVYADSARIGNNGGARIAYRDSRLSGGYTRTTLDPLYTASDATNSSGWEALTMPAQYTVNNDRLNIEAWPPQRPSNVSLGATAPAWNAAIGYGSDLFRLGYFTKPAAAVMTGTVNSINWQEQ